MLEYACDFYEFDGSPRSLQSIQGFAELMNKYAKEGWTLVDVKPVAVGFLAIFSRPVEVKPALG